MSNRKKEHSTEQAEYEASWIAQIEALTAPGLSDEERVKRFAEAAGFDEIQTELAMEDLNEGLSPAYAAWDIRKPEKSLFGDLPGCRCPVFEKLEGVPQSDIPDDWQPDEAQLLVFVHHQREKRFPNA